jgi:hypothetical protein
MSFELLLTALWGLADCRKLYAQSRCYGMCNIVEWQKYTPFLI